MLIILGNKRGLIVEAGGGGCNLRTGCVGVAGVVPSDDVEIEDRLPPSPPKRDMGE